MKYLNLGCGNNYSTEKEWTNLDFISNSKNVIGHNLLNGIPFTDQTFDLVYHSHVLEHFTKEDGEKFIKECFRVLKPGGIIRIAIPDLEVIAKNYLKFLEEGLAKPDDKMTEANYSWTMLELFDQIARNKSGGNMGNYLKQEHILNEDFVFERIGKEGQEYRNAFLSQRPENQPFQSKRNIISVILQKLKAIIIKLLGINITAYETGLFKLSGEVHQWMYDRYSLTKLLTEQNAAEVKVTDAFSGYIQNWSAYNLDGKDAVVRKPDSLFIEAKKRL